MDSGPWVPLRWLGPPTLLGLALALVAGQGQQGTAAWASSPQAWQAYGRQVLQACRSASQLRQPAPAGERVDLPDRNGRITSVLLLRGTYPQATLAGRRGLELCLFESASGRARVAEADRLLGGSGSPGGGGPTR